ncbi:MAG: DUF2520 domain-containing protein [Propionibacteriaceae bacterium]|nr:DUF2520 domain-containing protein [Propionibacteriaceae bacterium]
MANLEDGPAPRVVGVIGAGRVGAVLGAALRAAGHELMGVTGSSPASLDRAATLLPGVPIIDAAEVVARSELVLVCVPDDRLPDVAAAGTWRSGQLVAHVSGRFGTGVLAPAAAAGAVPMALHPAMTFTGTARDLDRLPGCCFGVTAPEPALAAVRMLVERIGARPVVIAEEDRTLYHASLAHGANHLVTLVAQARQLLSSMGVADPGRLLGPLLRAALENSLEHGDLALTGPVARGDTGTVAAHLEVVGARATSPDLPATYAALARATTERALASGRLPADRAARLLELFDHPGTGHA